MSVHLQNYKKTALINNCYKYISELNVYEDLQNIEQISLFSEW